MDTVYEKDHENLMDPTDMNQLVDNLAALGDEGFQEQAVEFMMGQAMQESPLFGQLNDMFSQWEVMLEAYWHDDMEEQLTPEGEERKSSNQNS